MERQIPGVQQLNLPGTYIPRNIHGITEKEVATPGMYIYLYLKSVTVHV